MADAASTEASTGLRLLEPSVALAVVALDQATKALVRHSLALHESVVVIPGVLDFTHIRNTGAAFGMLDAAEFPFKTAVIAAIAVAALVGITLHTRQLAHDQVWARTGLSLIIGGAAGNLIDRVVVGSVVDFVDVYWRSHHFWAFNVADSAITVGVGVMILDMIGVGKHVSKTV